MSPQGASLLETVVQAELAAADAIAKFWYTLFVAGVNTSTDQAVYKDGDEQQIARLKADIAIAMVNPTNNFWFNPEARAKAWKTNGQSVLDGMHNFYQDLNTNEGNPALVDRSKFGVGVNLGTTRGKVVFRNKLFELIRYAAVTKLVHQVPLLFVPPQINKYYIMDLAPGRSLIEHAVNKGQDVFVISWVNPGKELAETKFYDYVTDGINVAMDVIGEKVNLLGLCLGGTLATMATAYDAATKANRVNSLTLIVSLTDFSGNTGVMGAMLDRKAVEDVYKMTSKVGYLTPEQMGSGWVWISSEGLRFAPARKRWLLGEEAPEMDLLYWNGDGTRLAARMHHEYLLACYIDNLLANGEMVINGHRLNIGDILVPVYAVGGKKDHIVPWRSSFAGISKTSGTHRFALVPNGHIGTIVAPASPRASYQVSESTYSESWEDSATTVTGDSWWTDWTIWLEELSGELIQRSANRQNLGAAPGTYVLTA